MFFFGRKQAERTKRKSLNLEIMLPRVKEYINIHSPAEHCVQNPDEASQIRYSLRSNPSQQQRVVVEYQQWERQHAVYKSFSSAVLAEIEQQGLTAKQFYERARMDRRLFSKLKTDYCYRPTKNTALCCALALHLPLNDAKELLKLAGCAFSETETQDLVIEFCLENRIYDIDDVNSLLYAMEIKTL